VPKVEIIDGNPENILEFGVCGYKSPKRPGFPEKTAWLKKRFREGLRLKYLHSPADGVQGMIEYLPGELCWRPVDAAGYTFIHCLFSGFRRAYKGRGYGSKLLSACLTEAKGRKVHGVCTVTRRGSFMAGREIFQRHGFEKVDDAPSDFELMVKKFRKRAPNPRFRPDREKELRRFRKGLAILRADQCPYTVKNVEEICRTAREEFGLRPRVVHLKTCEDAQRNPCAFGTFGIVLRGEIIAEHPISNTRFKNIMDKIERRKY
jgi:L-amino acid N-acyltransferase YncA